jgi:beta-mannanase
MGRAGNLRWSMSPQSYVAAWVHIWNLFRRAGVTNAAWVWCPTTAGFAQGGGAVRFYPGARYVDWVCADGYNPPPGQGGPWRSFGQVFGPFLAWAAAAGKPAMLAEVGVREGAVGAKADWFAAAHHDIETRYPGLKAFVYFDSGVRDDWRAASSPQAEAALRALADDPYFGQPRG